MRRSVKPFVVEQKTRWRSKREQRPLFSQDELRQAQAEPAAEAPSRMPEIFRVAPPKPVQLRILPDLRPLKGAAATSAGSVRTTEERDHPAAVESTRQSDGAVSAAEVQKAAVDIRPLKTEILITPAAARKQLRRSRPTARRGSQMPKQERFAKMSLEELVAMRGQIQAAIDERVEAERQVLQTRMNALSGYRAENGTSGGPSKSGGRVSASGRRPKAHPLAGKKVAIKYRGPNGETWSGRGLAPRWLTELEAKGKKRESYLVK
jgi:DNA-binding protein H-NS